MPSENHAQALQVLSYVDLTSLNNDDDKATIESLCAKVTIGSQSVAAICVFPEWVATAQAYFEKHNLRIPLATVTNFPDGSTNIERAAAETERAIAAGAHEIDVVLPYRALLNGDESTPAELVRECKDICGDEVTLKVIIESGELKTQDAIVAASEIAIANGADFIKTSTGKVQTNATLSAAQTMLGVIKASGSDCGFKAAGGIRTVEEAMQYINLAEEILGKDWVTPEHFRIGASSLLKDVQSILDNR
ncbi:deoxyribose-phosphate aldolase [Idiomarina sp.]|uniref:deoxyribose-phosphate aldolase n=1 Tax=Idiomarina sp. TaxID=1874361 RepID=UPI001DEE9644|nr:deoxyribose-phosphate aldolase [Idiomarina sp.]MCJ8317947.1 deoxyribose-phosphate aldolase [Idiomarina sp.]NQZ17601.1 deoxyribose-phosphate aldolase [Idiomarina sp.]